MGGAENIVILYHFRSISLSQINLSHCCYPKGDRLAMRVRATWASLS